MKRSLLVIAALTIASTAQAQIEVPPMDMAGAMLNREAMRVQLGNVVGPDRQRRVSGGALRNRPAAGLHLATGPVATVRTSYRSDPAVTTRVRRQFLDFIRRTDGPAGAEALQRAFSRVDPLQHWAQFVAVDGMRLGDLGDALTEYWVQNWKMANGVEDAAPTRVRAVRAQVQSIFAHSPELARLDEAQRQEMAETFIYNMSVQGEVYGSALKSGDRALLARMSDAAQARMRNEMHLDTRRLTLTDAGFVDRG